MWLYFRPKERPEHGPIYIEIASDKDVSLGISYFKSFMHHLCHKHFFDPQKFVTFDYASAYERGCVVKTDACGLVAIKEEKRLTKDNYPEDAGIDFPYMTVPLYKQTYEDIRYLDKVNAFALSLKKTDPKIALDGVFCRECSSYIQYGEPDLLKEDHKRTCYDCINYLKSMQRWPYK